jgi:uncharacterized protein involved in response to NO
MPAQLAGRRHDTGTAIRAKAFNDRLTRFAVKAAAVHAWTAGSIALITLAVMTRASLGHTGQPLTASNIVMGIYLAAALGAAARILAAFGVAPIPMLTLAALGWTLAFSGFSFVFAPLLATSAPSSRRCD